MGEDLLGATDLRGRIRRHPFLAVGLGATLGLVGGPVVLRMMKRVLGAASGMPLPGLALAALRSVRARQ